MEQLSLNSHKNPTGDKSGVTQEEMRSLGRTEDTQEGLGFFSPFLLFLHCLA